MIKEKIWSKFKRKTSVVEPKFGKIFIVCFLICLLIFSLVAKYALNRLEERLWEREAIDQSNSYEKEIIHLAEILSKEDPGSAEYKRDLNALKNNLAFYQAFGYNYAEVRIGDYKIATDKDTALIYLEGSELDFWESYFIEDISYLDPLYEYMEEIGMNSEREFTDLWFKYGRDPLLFQLGIDMPYDRSVWLKSYYINYETSSFIPGVVRLCDNKGSSYYIDCTPPDTKGYEYIECSMIHEKQLILANRVAPDLSSDSITLYVVPGTTGGIRYLSETEFYDPPEELEYDKTWQVGISGSYYQSVFEIAPFSCALIIVINVAAALVLALVLSVIRYQRDKTVWKIFEYRTKTTEAMAHDLKTPLAAIMAYAENMEASSEDPTKVREYSKSINEKVITMDRMIGDILSFSRSETGKLDVVKEELSVAELVRESLEAFPELKAEIDGDIRLKTDKKLLKQAIDNLLSNCDRYGDKDFVVGIRIDPEKLLIINKTDKTYDDADSLKKPFIKGEDSRGGKGTGLGLSIAENNLIILGFKLELVSEPGIFKAIVIFG